MRIQTFADMFQYRIGFARHCARCKRWADVGIHREVFTWNALELAAKRVLKSYNHENATPWTERNVDLDRRYLVAPGGSDVS